MKKLISALFVSTFALALVGCESEPDTPGEVIEEAGEELGEAVDEVADEVKDAAEEVEESVEN